MTSVTGLRQRNQDEGFWCVVVGLVYVGTTAKNVGQVASIRRSEMEGVVLEKRKGCQCLAAVSNIAIRVNR